MLLSTNYFAVFCCCFFKLFGFPRISVLSLTLYVYPNLGDNKAKHGEHIKIWQPKSWSKLAVTHVLLVDK